MAVLASTLAVVIARVSSKGQEEEGFSLEAQVKTDKALSSSLFSEHHLSEPWRSS